MTFSPAVLARHPNSSVGLCLSLGVCIPHWPLHYLHCQMAPAASTDSQATPMAHATRGGHAINIRNGLFDDGADGLDSYADANVETRSRRSSSVESALSLVGDDLARISGMTSGGCCRGYSTRLLFLMGCAMIEYVAHTVVLVLGPMIALHFYPTTSYPRLGFYTAILTGAGYLGSMLSCKMWINIARSLKSAKGVILWGLAILGTGFFSLLLCQSLLAMAIVRFAMGLFSGVTPVALIEIDNICGNRQTRLAVATKYMGILVGAGASVLLVGLGDKLFTITATEHDDSALYFYPFCFVSILSWIAVVVTLIGLRIQSRASYVPLTNDDDPNHKAQRRSALDDSPTGSSNGSTSSASSSLTKVKTAIEETFRRSKNPLKTLLREPRPHFRTIRSILPHFYHGYTESGHVVIWDFLGQIKLDKLVSAGFTTPDIRSHYQFFIHFALEKLVKSSSQKIVYVVDLEGLTLTDADDRVVESAGAIIEEMQKSFPEKLAQLAVINAPVWFSQVMAGVKSKVSKRTLDKIQFFPVESTAAELLELLGVDTLPKKYGGRNGVEFGKSSQERALSDHLRQTTGVLEETKEIISGGISRRGRAGSLRSDGDSDEEAFFDCSEYGLQGDFDDDDEISIVVHSQSSSQHATSELVARGAGTLSPTRTKTMDKKVHDVDMGTTIAEAKRKSQVSSSSHAADFNSSELAITREPHALLILAVFFAWSLVQFGFDEILPLWFFRKHPVAEGAIHAAVDSSSAISSKTMHLAISLASMAFTFLCGQLVLCRSSSSVMTPLATLRVGLLLQIPAVGAFPLLNVFHLDTLPFASALVVVLVLIKHSTGVVALHGLMALLDNSIAVDRRLIAHRSAHVVSYAACLISSGGTPALFALLGYFAKSFPLDQSLLYFVQALGLAFLFLFSFLIPSRLNFPMLFAMSKR